MTNVAPLQKFLATRFYPPRGDGDAIAVASIDRIVTHAVKHRLTVIKAPAGYGKTTTMSASYWLLAKQEGVTAWLNLTGFDGSLNEFVRHFAEALSWSIAGVSAQSELPGDTTYKSQTIKSLSRGLSNAASDFGQPAYLFLDDFDAIVGTEAECFVYQVLKDAPPNLHLVVSCRSAPSFGLGRLRMQGQLMEVNAEQLCFSQHEAKQFLESVTAAPVSSELVASIVEKTEGWPAGLQLVAISMANSADVEKLLASFNGEVFEVGQYLAEDVLENLDETLIDFLLQTSVLTRFCASLCDAVTGRNDSRAIINELERRSLFILSLDGEMNWYRYQSLFSNFLLRNLHENSPELIAQLNLKACDWCVADGLVVEGVRYALAAEAFNRAADILDTNAAYLLGRGLLGTVQGLVAQLPDTVLQKYPSLQLWHVTNLIVNRRFREARPMIKEVEKYLDNVRRVGHGDDGIIPKLRNELLRAKMMLAQFMDDMPALERLCEQVLADSDGYDQSLIGILHISLLHAQREQYRLDQVELRSALAAKCLEAPGHLFPLVVLESVVGPSYIQRGESETAAACFTRAIVLCEGSVDDTTDRLVIRAGVAALLAELMLERFEIEQCRQLYERNPGETKGIGFVDNLVASFIGRSRLAALDNDHDLADNLLREGIEVAIAQSLERLRWCCVDERIRQHVARNDVWGALRIASNSELPASDANLYPVGEFTTKREAMAMAWARTAIVAGRPKEALKLLKRWLLFVERNRAVRSQIKLSILTAHAYQAIGEMRSALRVVSNIIPRVIDSGLILHLADEGQVIRSLVMQACGIDSIANETVRDFGLRLKQVLADGAAQEIHVSPAPVVEIERADDLQYEALTSKEVEILRLVARSMRNKEIADWMGLTEGTVKWYFQQIYDKFGVRRRYAALERARTLGYL